MAAGPGRVAGCGRKVEVVEPWIDVSPVCPAGRERLRFDVFSFSLSLSLSLALSFYLSIYLPALSSLFPSFNACSCP